MENFKYIIDGEEFEFPTEKPVEFHYGENEVLSNKNTDIIAGQTWYDDGFTTSPIISELEYKKLKFYLDNCIYHFLN